MATYTNPDGRLRTRAQRAHVSNIYDLQLWTNAERGAGAAAFVPKVIIYSIPPIVLLAATLIFSA